MGMGNAESYLSLINRYLTTKSIADGPYFEYPARGIQSQFSFVVCFACYFVDRERNRLLARKTRMRKKFFFEVRISPIELKRIGNVLTFFVIAPFLVTSKASSAVGNRKRDFEGYREAKARERCEK